MIYCTFKCFVSECFLEKKKKKGYLAVRKSATRRRAADRSFIRYTQHWDVKVGTLVIPIKTRKKMRERNKSAVKMRGCLKHKKKWKFVSFLISNGTFSALLSVIYPHPSISTTSRIAQTRISNPISFKHFFVFLFFSFFDIWICRWRVVANEKDPFPYWISFPK